MSRNNSLYIIFLILISCSSQKKFSSVDLSGQYNDQQLRARYRIWNYSADSALLYFQIERDGLLFKKQSGNYFENNLQVNYILFDEHGQNISDSSTMLYVIKFDSLDNAVNGNIKFRAPVGNNYILNITLTDLFRNRTVSFGIPLRIKNNSSSTFFNLYDNFDEPLISTIVFPGDAITLHPPPVSTDSLFVRCYFRTFPLAPPPFSLAPLQTFDLHSDSVFKIPGGVNTSIGFSKKGIYFIQRDTLSTEGLTLFCTDQDYPKFTMADQLIEALRYLSTAEEYDKLKRSQDKRKAIDDYWLSKAGSNERGRNLIRVYYGRAQEANINFTSYLEGWKTDRGMIYIIFGPPTSVYRNGRNETWYYNFPEGLPDMRLNFTNISNPFTNEDYTLDREIELQNPWYNAVDSWRNGRIIGEY